MSDSPTAMPPLITDRLIIRPFVASDLDAIHAALLDYHPLSRDERAAWLRWSIDNVEQLAALYQPPYGDRAIARRDDNTVIGACGLVPAMGPFGLLPSFADIPPGRRAHYIPQVGLFYALAPEARGQGYATETAQALIDYGFRAWNLDRIIAQTEADNEASMAVMRRVGMRVERNPEPEPEWFQVVGVIDAPSGQPEADRGAAQSPASAESSSDSASG
jgi:RimJ/RimL family protein N-acetyltransferase